MGNIGSMIKWFKDREWKVIYDNARPWGYGHPAQYDCSSAVIESLRYAKFIPDGTKFGWTGSLHDEILPTIAKKISREECRRGDIFLSNWYAYEGHTGVFLDNNTIIHCNAYDMTISTSVADGRMGNAPYEYYRLLNATDDNSDNIYTGGDLIMPDDPDSKISQSSIRALIKYAAQYNLRPSFLVTQMFHESLWGNPRISIVGSVDNNWSGISEPFYAPDDLGINMSRGSARPTAEGGYYVHFATLEDYFKAYTFVLSNRNGYYKVEGATTIGDFVKGLFIVGGAKANYAAVGYEQYSKYMMNTYAVMDNLFHEQLVEMDGSSPGSDPWVEPVVPITELAIYTVNEVKFVNNMWQVRCDFLVPVDFNWTENGICATDIILVDKQGNRLENQNTIKPGTLFVFDQKCVIGVYDTLQGSGGYYWSRSAFKYGGVIWLSVWNKEHLLFGNNNGGSGTGTLIPASGTFYPNIKLPVSADTDPNSPALDYYEPGQSIYYDSYLFANGYAWISYISYSGSRSYVAVGPDDGRTDTVWGTGFLSNHPNNSGNVWTHSGVFYPNIKLPVSADTDPSSPALDYYEPGQSIYYDSYLFVNGYAWISYTSTSGLRRYVAVGPDDGRTDTVWGTGFFN